MTSHSELYKSHLQSPQWREVRGQVLRRANYQCERCGTRNTGLQVHHRNYLRLGRERLSDLEALCPDCHKVADETRPPTKVLRKAHRSVARLMIAERIEQGMSPEEIKADLERLGIEP